ncbi:hypothetical protein [Streptomyces sp. NPDC060022]|uniref:hypothetical protein n=1 Tax=Streptomyces sp. NPDC060022 TaxID=3347039 RepID=UPI0036CBEE76
MAVLEIVRYFNDGEYPDKADRSGPNLFGWHLGGDLLDFLDATGAVLDVGEYETCPRMVQEISQRRAERSSLSL